METTIITQNSDQEVMRAANARMEKWQALQMHRLIHQAGARQLSFEEQKILDTLLEIHNEVARRKAQGIAEAIRRGLLPPMNDAFWSAPRRQLMPKKKKWSPKKSGVKFSAISNRDVRTAKCRRFICRQVCKKTISFHAQLAGKMSLRIFVRPVQIVMRIKPVKFLRLILNPAKKSLYSIHVGKSGLNISNGANPEQK